MDIRSFRVRLRTRRLAGVASTAAIVATALVAPSSTAQADGPTECDPGRSWVKLVNRSNFLQVDRGDTSPVQHNGTSQNMTITDNFSFTVGSSASRSTTTGTNVDVGVTVGWFNAGAGYETGSTNAMERSHSFSAGVTRNITLEPGQRAIAYAGDRFGKAFVYKRYCNSRGEVVTTWTGWVKGPRYKEQGWLLCSRTRLC